MTKKSALFWDVAIIVGISLLLPLSFGFASGEFLGPERETHFEAETHDDMSLEWTGEDEDGNEITDSEGLYTQNETGDEYHFYITPTDENVTFRTLEIELEYTVEQAIDDSIDSLDFEFCFPFSGEVVVEAYGEDQGDTYDFYENVYETSTSIEGYSLEIDTIDLLSMQDQLSEYATFVIEIRNEDLRDEAEHGNVLPSGGYQFNFDAGASSEYAADPIVSLNIFSALWGIGLTGVALFATPILDFSDFLAMLDMGWN